MGVLSPLPHPLTLQLPVSIAGPGDDEGLADEKEGYFYPGCCIDRWLLPTHSHTHTHTHTHTWSYRKIFITYKEARKHNQAILQCVGVHFVGSVTSGFVG